MAKRKSWLWDYASLKLCIICVMKKLLMNFRIRVEQQDPLAALILKQKVPR